MSTAPTGGTEATAGAAAAPSASDRDGNLTAAQRNALRSAKSYLAMSGFSRQGLIDQLSSEYGEKFSVADATAAVDNLNVDWKAQAARSAAAYLEMSGFSCRGLIDQLSSPSGEQFTVEQATYGAGRAGIC
ncbi:MAG TPA: Ltp family lipoprotein [Longimicrobium sp.]